MESIFGPLDHMLSFMGAHADLWAYAFIFVIATAEMLFPPTPGDVVFLSGMVLAGGGALEWWIVFAVAFVGGLIGCWLLYELGLWKGRAWFARSGRKLFNPAMLGKIDSLFDRYGRWIIVLARYVPGIRSVVPIATGIVETPRPLAALYLSLSIIFWNGALAAVGLLFGHNWEAVTSLVAVYNKLVIGGLIVGGAIWGFWLYKQSRPTNNKV